jgi:hypothetical protein
MTADMFLRDGSKTGFASNTGILDISDPAHHQAWDYRMCFFSTCKDLVRIVVA